MSGLGTQPCELRAVPPAFSDLHELALNQSLTTFAPPRTRPLLFRVWSPKRALRRQSGDSDKDNVPTLRAPGDRCFTHIDSHESVGHSTALL